MGEGGITTLLVGGGEREPANCGGRQENTIYEITMGNNKIKKIKCIGRKKIQNIN
jgi:hypothetical protein